MLAVTHNIDLAKRFEKICVVAQGTVVEVGPVDKLLALNGHFAQMVRNLSGITVLPSGIAVITAERMMDMWIFSRVPEVSYGPIHRGNSSGAPFIRGPHSSGGPFTGAQSWLRVKPHPPPSPRRLFQRCLLTQFT